MKKAGGKSSRSGVLTIGEAARMLAVSASTLRLWENVGLVSPRRSEGGFRLFTPEMMATLKRIKYLREVQGLNVQAIRQVLESEADALPRTPRSSHPGPKLRRLRKRKQLSLSAAAKSAGISAGFLSSIERGQANASIATLQTLVTLYGTTVRDFLDLPRSPGRLTHPFERDAVEAASGVTMELLTPGAHTLESYLIRLAPGSGSEGAYSHDGEEAIYVLSGEFHLWLDELDRHHLRQGDSFWFDSNQSHRWRNASETEEAVLIWTHSPPTF